MKRLLFATLCMLCILTLPAQQRTIPVLMYMPLEVDFDHTLQDWDGFGFNYVETAQTKEYDEWPQDYGGFSLLDENEKEEIIDLVFGEDGLKVGIVKMFLDPWHQDHPLLPYNHTRTTANMREFVKAGYEKTRERGGDLQIITTLYGPPHWATKQKYIRGRDLDPDNKYKLAEYMVDWVKFLKEEEGLPVRYISLHNEGEDWQRWPRDGNQSYLGEGHDYNMWWPSEQTIDFLKFMPDVIAKAGLEDVYVTNGECSNWFRFSHWGDAYKIAENDTAVQNLGLITSHGFYNGTYNYWYGDHNPLGINEIKKKRPNIHAWTTSSSWANMDAHFVRQIYGSIYSAGVNGFIPWAGIQRPSQWVGSDPNPGNAIQVDDEGNYTVRDGYYFYKQVTVAGQPGMKVARTITLDSDLTAIAFASNGTEHPDAIVLINSKLDDWKSKTFSNEDYKYVMLQLKGTDAKQFEMYRTDGVNERFKYVGLAEAYNGQISYLAPKGSVTTFIAVK